tara:strand:+ start:235 stop:501 length:267 start_codon:yes stop_codon:yes gene_type:complete
MEFIEKSTKMNEEEIENIIFNIRQCTGMILELIRKKQYDTFKDVMKVMKENMQELDKHLIVYKKLTAKTLPMTVISDILNVDIIDEDL